MFRQSTKRSKVPVEMMVLFSLYFFFSLCGATEYYVRPTEPTDTSCPAQPCLTLSQYISNSDLYFKSNTVFKFLPGLHHANQTLDMHSVENVSLEGRQNSSHPVVMMDIHCSSLDCAGFRFQNTTNLTIHSLCFSMYFQLLPSFVPNVENLSVSGFMYIAVNALQIHHTTVQFASSIFTSHSSAIAVLSSEQILLHSLTTFCSNNSWGTTGVYIKSSWYTTISRSVVMYALQSGISIWNSHIIDIVNTEVSHSGWFGLDINYALAITVTNTTFTEPSSSGIFVYSSIDITIFNASVTSSAVRMGWGGDHGMYFWLSLNVVISNVVVNHARLCGISIGPSWLTTVSSAVVMNTQYHGICLTSSQNTTISKVTVMHSKQYGILLGRSNNTDVVDVMISYSGEHGLGMNSLHHVTVTNTSITQSSQSGIIVNNSTNIAIVNVSVVYSGTKKCAGTVQDGNMICCGLQLVYVSTALLHNIKVMYSEDHGIRASHIFDITVKNMTVTYIKDGIYFVIGSNIHISFTTIENFTKSGITASLIQHSSISNVTLVFTPFQELAVVITYSRSVQIESIFLVPNHRVGVKEHENIASIDFCSEISISKSVFKNFNAPLFHFTSEGQPTVLILSFSNNIIFSDCTFEGNNITGLALFRSNLTISGNLNFTGNRAYKGAAMVLAIGSVMKLSQNGSAYFVNNSAISKGGAIYLDSSNSYGYQSHSVHAECFLQVEQADLHKRLVFVNSSAGQGGDALYGRTLGYSPWPRNYSLNCSSLFDEDNDDCSVVELSNEYINYANCSFVFAAVSSITPNTLSQVASNPVRVCICNNSTPECHMTSMAVDPIFPGQSFSISTVVVGEELGTVIGSVFANFLPLHSNRPQLAAGEDTQGATQLHCNTMEYTIFSINSTEVLVLTTDSVVGEYTDPTSFTKFPVYVNITLLPCPPGFSLMETSAICDCSQFLLQLPAVSCDIKDQTIHRSGLVWVGSVKDENQTVENVITAKYCPLNYCKREGIRVDLNQPDTQCEFNHSGILCGGCQPGLSLMLGGVQCEVCSNKNLAFLIPFILAGVVLVFFLKISKLTTSEGFINSLVFYANIVKANEHIFLPQANTNPLTLFISWLNLDLGVQTCFFNGLSAYTKTWLQFIFPFYIWGITGVIIISARYSIGIARISGNNSVPVLATLFLLSYAKLLGIIITSLSYTVLEYPGGQKIVWSADGNIDYLGAKHAPLFVAAVATLLFLWLPYTVLLFTGQWLYKCKLSLMNRMLIKLKPFLDAHYGPLKDSHRYWFGALLLVRAVILLISALVTKNNFSVFIFSISIATVVLIMLTAFSHIGIDLCTYRSKAVSFFEYAIFFNLVILCLAKYHISASGGSEIAASYTLIGIVFVQFVGLLVFRIYSAVKKKAFHYFPMNESKEEEGVWRYENSIEMQTIQYANATNV